jgi:hypothetical protein
VVIQFWLGLAAMVALVLFLALLVNVFFTLVAVVVVQTTLAQKALAV